jgi:hypothetical protein
MMSYTNHVRMKFNCICKRQDFMMSYEKECHMKLKCICNKLHIKFEFKVVKEIFAANLNLNLISYLYVEGELRYFRPR